MAKHPNGTKHPSESAAEAAFILQHKDINGENRLFGGRLMEWIDSVAGIAARRHCGGSITTACVDSLVFKHAAYLNDIVVVKARVTYVGNTSMEVRVDAYVEEDATGERYLINTAYLTEVHVDSQGRPQPIAWGLDPETDEEREEWNGAVLRKAIRKEREANGI